MNQLISDKPYNTNIIDLRDLLNEVVKNKRLILSLIIAGVIFAIFYNCFQMPKYKADVLVQVRENDASAGGTIAIKRALFADNKNEAVYSALLSSRYILGSVIDQLGLDVRAKPEGFPIVGSIFSTNKKIQISEFVLPHNEENKIFTLVINSPGHFQLYDQKKEVLSGTVGQRAYDVSGTIVLQVKTLQGKIGSRFIIENISENRVIKEILPSLVVKDLGLVSEKGEKTGILQVSYLDKDPVRLVNILNTAVHILQQKNITQKSNKAKEVLTLLQTQLPLAKTSLENAEAVFNQYREKSKKIDIKAETQFLLMQLANIDKQISKLRLNRRALLRENTEDHPFIHEIDDKIQSLLLERKEWENKLKELPAADEIYLRLMRDVKVKQEVYLTLYKKIQELKVEAAASISDIEVLSFAKMPSEPVSQYPWLVMLAGAVLGFLVGCIIIFVRKILFPRVTDPNWIEYQLSTPILAMIPFSSVQNNLLESQILAKEYAKDSALESLRNLRTNLQVLLCTANNNIINIIGLTPQTGKTFITVNLAYLLADAGKKVLLIDGDLRKGHLQDYFGVPSTPGFSDVIRHPHMVSHALHVTLHPNLTLLTAGSSTQPSELLLGASCADVINKLSLQYDIVIINTSSILAVTDAAIIGRLAGTNLLVLGADFHHSIEIDIGKKRLSQANVKLHGVIYNNIKKERYAFKLFQYNY